MIGGFQLGDLLCEVPSIFPLHDVVYDSGHIIPFWPVGMD